jgi:ABC-type lipoprotein release transport system permease subunit
MSSNPLRTGVASFLASSAGRVLQSVIMAAVGVLACAAPARRALRVQPTEALRQD